MATDLENLEAIRSLVIQRLADLDRKPNASGSNTIDHVGEKDSLWRELREINAQIATAGGPFEVTSEMTA